MRLIYVPLTEALARATGARSRQCRREPTPPPYVPQTRPGSEVPLPRYPYHHTPPPLYDQIFPIVLEPFYRARFTRYAPSPEFGINLTVTHQTSRRSSRLNRHGRTLEQEIDHRRRLAFIREGNPATLDLWYPPEGQSVYGHILELRQAQEQLNEQQRSFRFYTRLITHYFILISIITFVIIT